MWLTNTVEVGKFQEYTSVLTVNVCLRWTELESTTHNYATWVQAEWTNGFACCVCTTLVYREHQALKTVTWLHPVLMQPFNDTDVIIIAELFFEYMQLTCVLCINIPSCLACWSCSEKKSSRQEHDNKNPAVCLSVNVMVGIRSEIKICVIGPKSTALQQVNRGSTTL
jgi:hypothetical protein